MERELLGIFRTLLNRHELQPSDDVFDFGCTSLLALQFTVLAAEHGYGISIIDVYMGKTVTRIAANALRGQEQTPEDSRPSSEESDGDFDPSPTAQFLLYEAGFREHYNISEAWNFNDGEIDPGVFRRAVSTIIATYAALRVRIVNLDGRYRMEVCQTVPDDPVEVRDVGSLPVDRQQAAITAHLSRCQREFEFDSQRPLVRYFLFMTSATSGVVAILAHHLIIDGVSFGLLRRELSRAYRSIQNNTVLRGALASRHPREWVDRLKRYANEEAPRELDFWNSLPWDDLSKDWEKSKGELSIANPPRAPTFSDEAAKALHGHYVDRVTPKNLAMLEQDQCIIRREIGDGTSQRFDRLDRQRGYFAVVLSISRTIWRASGEKALWIDVFNSARGKIFDDFDNARVVGYVNEIAPLLLSVDYQADAASGVAAVEQQMARMPREGLGFRALRYLNADESIRAAGARWVRPSLCLNYVVPIGRDTDGTLLGLPKTGIWIGQDIDEEKTPYLLTFTVAWRAGRIEINLRYHPTYTRYERAQEVSNILVEELTTVVEAL